MYLVLLIISTIWRELTDYQVYSDYVLLWRSQHRGTNDLRVKVPRQQQKKRRARHQTKMKIAAECGILHCLDE